MSITTTDFSARPTFLLVHGSITSSFMWAPLQRELALLGHRSFAIDLPGHGLDAQYSRFYQAPQDLDAWAQEPSTLAEVTLDDNVDAVGEAIRRLREHGPVVLVGASLGGLTITLAANRYPELVDGLVYISAWACASGKNPYEYMSAPEFDGSLLAPLAALNIGDPAALGAGRANNRTSDIDLLRALKSASMADVTDAQFMAFLNIMQSDESIAVMTGDARLEPTTWGTIPHGYIRQTEDRTFPVAMQDRIIREADELTPDNPFRVHTMHSSHVGFVFQSDEVAKVLNDWS